MCGHGWEAPPLRHAAGPAAAARAAGAQGSSAEERLATAMAQLLGAACWDSGDEAMMAYYKVLPCVRRTPHSWVTCPCTHPGEKVRRRPLSDFEYSSKMCPNVRLNQPCPKEDGCPYAHNTFESWLHPEAYRTKMCTDGPGCRRKVCFFAHRPSELRSPAASISAAARGGGAASPAAAAGTPPAAQAAGGFAAGSYPQASPPSGSPLLVALGPGGMAQAAAAAAPPSAGSPPSSVYLFLEQAACMLPPQAPQPQLQPQPEHAGAGCGSPLLHALAPAAAFAPPASLPCAICGGGGGGGRGCCCGGTIISGGISTGEEALLMMLLEQASMGGQGPAEPSSQLYTAVPQPQALLAGQALLPQAFADQALFQTAEFASQLGLALQRFEGC